MVIEKERARKEALQKIDDERAKERELRLTIGAKRRAKMDQLMMDAE